MICSAATVHGLYARDCSSVLFIAMTGIATKAIWRQQRWVVGGGWGCISASILEGSQDRNSSRNLKQNGNDGGMLFVDSLACACWLFYCRPKPSSQNWWLPTEGQACLIN